MSSGSQTGGAARVAMVVLNSCHADARVRKEAATLSARGYDVRVFALGNSTWPAGIFQEAAGFTIQRLEVTSVPQRVLWTVRSGYLTLSTGLTRVRGFSMGLRARRVRPVSTRPHQSGPSTPTGRPTHSWSRARRRGRPGEHGQYSRANDEHTVSARSTARRSRWSFPGNERSESHVPVSLLVRLGLGTYVVSRRVMRGARRAAFLALRRLRRATRRVVRRARRAASRSRRWTRRRTRIAHSQIWRSARSLLRRSYRLLHWSLRRLLLPLHRPSVIRQFQREASTAISGWNPHIVHAHDGNTLLGAGRAAEACEAKLVYDSHELWRRRNRGRELRPLGRLWDASVERLVVPRCDAVITVSERIARWLDRTYRLDPPAVVIRNVPENVAISDSSNVAGIRQLSGVGESDRLILYTGRITTGRGLPMAVEALPRLADDYVLVLLGYGDELFVAQLLDRAEQLGVGDRVRTVPPVPPSEVSRTARDADVAFVGIEPICLSYRYSLPNKLFEALQARLPVVASDLPEIRRIVSSYGCGELFDPKDPVTLAAAIERCCADSSYLDGAERAASELIWELEQQRLVELYQQLGVDAADTLEDCYAHAPDR